MPNRSQYRSLGIEIRYLMRIALSSCMEAFPQVVAYSDLGNEQQTC